MIKVIFFILISQISYSQLSEKDIEKFEVLSDKFLLIDDILVSSYEKSFKDVSPSFLEEVNKGEVSLEVADKKYHKFIPMFCKHLNNEVSIYIILQNETYSNSKYVYLLVFKNDICINLRNIYCNSEVYKPRYNKNFGAEFRGDTIRLFDMESGYFEVFEINQNGEIRDSFIDNDNNNKSIYNAFLNYYSNNSIKFFSKDSTSNLKVLLPLSKIYIKTHNVIPLPINVDTESFESYLISKVSEGEITKFYYLNKCILTNGKQENIVVREVYKGNKNTAIDNKL